MELITYSVFLVHSSSIMNYLVDLSGIAKACPWPKDSPLFMWLMDIFLLCLVVSTLQLVTYKYSDKIIYDL